ncbi:DNA modification methylase [Mesorhizobium sp. BR1-1-2]|uniref:DNA modification methylase n=1 Tax=Mesorhizobium sp. BR1-1-2 TaxID=2876652 RepID=UPI001CCE9B37|nr:DNA modification methylase [Mesorhizobium sp. BR1-1-2]MBZ9965008.1 DNA modification methylase [Mesorhizobium sp. BR1-1-2]
MKNHLQMHLTPISEVRVSPYAVRNHNLGKIRKLVIHIERYGQIIPIIIEGGGYVVDGHARLAAAQKAGLTHVLTIDISHLPEADRRAVRLALNRLGEDGMWDKKALARELRHLLEIGYELDLTGFDTLQIENTIEMDIDAPGDVEELDARLLVEKPVSKVGDIWILANGASTHRLACGDCRDEDLLQRLFDGLSASVSFADAPYNVPIEGFVSGLGKASHQEFAMASGEMSPEQFGAFLRAVLTAIFGQLTEGGLAYVCMDWRHIADLVKAAEALGLELVNLAVWVKTNPGMGSFLRSQHELVAIFKRTGEKYRNNVELGKHGRSRSNVWQYRGVNVMGPERHLLSQHPTVKPSAMVADALRDSSKPGDIVFDPFLGSGTTLLAAERSRRICFGVEIEPRFVDLAIRRWQAETGLSAVRLSDGLGFDEAQAAPAAKTSKMSPEAPQ